jgi:predicted ATPase/DNA-binding winged helix-turn-helix (wHTH) protein
MRQSGRGLTLTAIRMPRVPERSRQPVYESGEYQIDLARRELRTRGVPVPVGGRAFEIIETLIQSAGELVTKSDLMDRVWPGAIVEENTLQVHLSAVRKALGPYRGMLKTESGRGYRLLGGWAIRPENPVVGPADIAPILARAGQPFSNNFPAMASGLIGRTIAVQHLRDLLSAYRAVTLTGPGGIGKTTLALEVARSLFPSFEGDGRFVELASLSDPELVPSSVASVLGLSLVGDRISAETVARAIGDKKLLLVLDNCEHVIDAAAELAETIVHLCRHSTVLTTSREALRTEGEHVYRVPPLDVPPMHDPALGDVAGHSAVQLFIARARALDSGFSPHGESLAVIATICARLDGIPLAIEFAAARVASLGLQEVAARLEDRFELLTGGRRTALPRHKTLRATLDWSYELLAGPERVILRRLAVFAGAFGLEAASTVVASAEVPRSEVVVGLASLVTKSLVAAKVDGIATGYRLLDTTRAYALEKLFESGERERLARRHAEYHRDLFERAETESETRSRAEWLADYGPEIDNLRAALDWAFSPGGDSSVGTALTAAAVPLWMHLSLLDEGHTRVKRALAAIEGKENADGRCEMKLHAALGLSLMQTKGPMLAAAAWTKVLEAAKALGDVEYQLRALGGLYMYRLTSGGYRPTLEIAQQLCSIAANQPDPTDWLVGNRMVGTALHYLGDQAEARGHLETMLSSYVTPVHRSHIVRFQFDQRVTAQCTLARVLWVQGFSDQAVSTAQSALDEAWSIGHELTLCNTLAQAACPVALEVGDLDTAEHYTALLLEYAARYALTRHAIQGRVFKGALLIQRGDIHRGVDLLRAALHDLRETGFVQSYPRFVALLADGLRRAGQAQQGHLAIDAALAHCEQYEERWCMAELLRIKGELVLLQGAPAAVAAEGHFRKALDWARQQDALSFELRASTNLVQLMRDQGRSADARALLQPICDRFTEGFDTADFRAATALLDALQ